MHLEAEETLDDLGRVLGELVPRLEYREGRDAGGGRDGGRRGGGEAEERGGGEGGLEALVGGEGREARGGAERARGLVGLGGGLGRREDRGERGRGGGQHARGLERGRRGGRGGGQRLERARAGEDEEQPHPHRYPERGGCGGGERVRRRRHRGEPQAIGRGRCPVRKATKMPMKKKIKKKRSEAETRETKWMARRVTWRPPASRVEIFLVLTRTATGPGATHMPRAASAYAGPGPLRRGQLGRFTANPRGRRRGEAIDRSIGEDDDDDCSRVREPLNLSSLQDTRSWCGVSSIQQQHTSVPFHRCKPAYTRVLYSNELNH